MFHEETKQYREPDEIRAEYEKERLMAASQIILAVIDYHKAKKMIAEKGITFEKYFRLDDWEKQIILNGKSAHEWITRKPRANGSGWTLEHCCELLGLSIEYIRDNYLKPSVFRDYKRLARSLGGANSDGRSKVHKEGYKRHVPPKGETNHKSKFTQSQADLIRAEYDSGGISQEKLAKKHGVAPSTVWRILRREVYA